LPENIIEKSLNKAYNFPYEAKTSYQRDVEIKGRLNEGDLFGGAIIREGQTLGIPTPLTESVYR
jgi:2-dehydropantoate 2-reductase